MHAQGGRDSGRGRGGGGRGRGARGYGPGYDQGPPQACPTAALRTRTARCESPHSLSLCCRPVMPTVNQLEVPGLCRVAMAMAIMARFPQGRCKAAGALRRSYHRPPQPARLPRSRASSRCSATCQMHARSSRSRSRSRRLSPRRSSHSLHSSLQSDQHSSLQSNQQDNLQSNLQSLAHSRPHLSLQSSRQLSPSCQRWRRPVLWRPCSHLSRLAAQMPLRQPPGLRSPPLRGSTCPPSLAQSPRCRPAVLGLLMPVCRSESDIPQAAVHAACLACYCQAAQLQPASAESGVAAGYRFWASRRLACEGHRVCC